VAMSAQYPAATVRAVLQPPPYFSRVVIFWVKETSTPFEHPPVLRVAWVLHCVEKIEKTGNAADILWWAATGPRNKRRIGDTRFAITGLFDDNVVAPVVAEVVDVQETAGAAAYQPAQTQTVINPAIPCSALHRNRWNTASCCNSTGCGGDHSARTYELGLCWAWKGFSMVSD